MKVKQSKVIVRIIAVKNNFGGLSLYIFQSFNISQKVRTPDRWVSSIYSSFDRMRDTYRSFLARGQ